MKSKKKLFEALDEIYKTDAFSKHGLKHRMISNETYGKKSFVYITHKSPAVRREVERQLQERGFKVSDDYAPGQSTSEVRVSYFKGFHWDE